ncbi:hypothetical protein [Aliivibrio fischeri]|uniref:hypothetical protein n=1 Tax=Aliivibrio fischeri TaxID=668 RepID=UPI0007C4CE55|nr:hypothetical protein [Aliivibrio fischeri]
MKSDVISEKTLGQDCYCIQIGTNNFKDNDQEKKEQIVNKVKELISSLTEQGTFHFLSQLQYDLEINIPFPSKYNKERLELIIKALEDSLKDSNIEQIKLFEFSPSIIPVSIMTSGSNAIQYHIPKFCYQVTDNLDEIIPPQDFGNSQIESMIKESIAFQKDHYSINAKCADNKLLSIGNILIKSSSATIVTINGRHFALCSLSFCSNVEVLAPFKFGFNVIDRETFESNHKELDNIGSIDDCNWWPKRFCPDIKTNLASFIELLCNEINANPQYVSEQCLPQVAVSNCQSEESTEALCEAIAEYIQEVLDVIGTDNNLFKVQTRSTPDWEIAVLIFCNDYALAKEFFYAINEVRQSSEVTCNSTSIFSL